MNPGLRIKDMPDAERPRERLLQFGAENLRSAELIAILLRTGLKGTSAVAIGEQLVARFGSLQNLAGASVEDLCRTRGIGRDKAIALKSAFTLAQRMAGELRNEAPLMDTPERIAWAMREECQLYNVEQFLVIHLNARMRMIRVEKISQGTLDTLLVHPREVFKSAILSNSFAIALVHNHPSGDPTPSEADVRTTRDLIRAGQLLKIQVIDHIIIGNRTDGRARDYVSLKELGLFHA